MQISVLWNGKLSRCLGSIGQITGVCWTSEALTYRFWCVVPWCRLPAEAPRGLPFSLGRDNTLGLVSQCQQTFLDIQAFACQSERRCSVSASNVSKIFDRRFAGSISLLLIRELVTGCVNLNTVELVFPLCKFSWWIAYSTRWINSGNHNDGHSPTAAFLQSRKKSQFQICLIYFVCQDIVVA